MSEKIIISNYGSTGAPDAAAFDKGAQTPTDIEQAIDRQRDQAEQLSPDDLAKRDR